MKPYFIKYFPKEGKIKPPCIVLETLATGEKELFQIDSKNDIDLKTQELVKVCLCSRNIDWVRDLKKKEEIHIYHDGSETPFKIIGEVSECALSFVKEGDEFEEDEVWIYYSNPFGFFGKFICSILNKSCGHFH